VVRIVRKRIFGVEIEAHPFVFPAAAILIIAFVVAAAWIPGRALILFDWLQSEIASRFAWLYVIAMTGFLVFAIFLCLSRYGKIRLGPDDVAPEFSTLTWFSMLFSAGMGIGMLFFGVAEPMWHYLAPPAGEGETLEAARQAMGITLFHWCLHPWALYALVGLALAYFSFRRGLPLSFRSVFYPLIGDRIHGPIGNAIDVMAVLATLFGLATSLGLGAKQVNAGLNYVFGLPQGIGIQVVLIACITAMAVASLVSGLHVGIRRLSEANMCLAGALLLFLFVAGPTGYLLESLVENVGAYFQRLPHNSFRTGVYDSRSSAGWLSSWTVFYWGWWIAWSPFVGMFIARVSKGRTIRELIIGVLLVPSAVATLWMTGFGNTALHQEIYQQVSDEPAAVESTFAYAPREYEVQALDEASGLPQTEDGQWLVGPHAHAVATPIGVLMEQNGDGFVTKSGVEVEYYRGVLVYRGTQRPYYPNDDRRYRGAYRSETAKLTLGGYLTKPVLSDDRSSRMDTTATAMFVMLEAYPLSMLTALIGTLCVVLFFVTSSDSASMVADIIASGGSENPTTGTRLFWGILEGVLAAVLLLAGGLKALQTASITIGLPFCLIVIGMCVSLYLGLKSEVDGTSVPEEK
jgi:choline/glycine/proline betaine transport protein